MYSKWSITLVLDKYTHVKMTSKWEIGAIEYKIKEILYHQYHVEQVTLYGSNLIITGTDKLPSNDSIVNAISQLC